ncbi:MAG: aspartate-semialdehyde dehydrogenase [Candidatus Eremiobacteraeota bacterium]|nr:aspartate-semialdehyde dehydrogenase [Candidatus Eremiobacteraeota bacterium]
MSKKYCVAVVGATGAVGSTMLTVLEEQKFPVSRLRPAATSRSAGSEVEFQGQNWVVEDIDQMSFEGVEVALFAGGEIASEKYAEAARAAGAVVIDNSATFRMHPDVPLVVPEVNPDHLADHGGIIANPNCSTIQMVVALAPLREAGLRRVIVCTYQSVSGTGKPAIDELENQTRNWAAGRDYGAAEVYPATIAFNLLPHIGSFLEDGYTGEERKMILETRKIMGLPELAVTATCVRVPTRYAHAESVYLETERELTVERAVELLRAAPGVKVFADAADYPTPLSTEGQDLTMVGRIHRDISVKNGLHLWVVADNLRKGAATNAVQIAQTLIARGQL